MFPFNKVSKSEFPAPPVLIPLINEAPGQQQQQTLLADVKPVQRALNSIQHQQSVIQQHQQQQLQQQQHQQPPAKKRNRKTINELTSSSYIADSHQLQHHLQQQDTRGLKLEETANQSTSLNSTQNFYQIDKDGNVRQQLQSPVVPVHHQYEQFNSQTTNNQAQNLHQQQINQDNVYNFNDNNTTTSTPNSVNNKNFQYQVMNSVSQQQQQQYRMPSPMLANLLSTGPGSQVTDGGGGNLSQINTSPVVIRQTSNNNYEYLNSTNNNNNNSVHGGISSYDPQQQQHTDFNLMKSDDYKHIYQMRQSLASKAAPNGQIFSGQPVQAAPVQATAAPKRKRAPADPSKVRTKRPKATAINTEGSNRVRTSFFKFNYETMT